MAAKISVIIPCFNQAHYLADAVSSVLAQTFAGWECIIVNDGSTDATEEIALQFAAKDKRIRYYKKQNGGLSSARNKGLDEATGEYIQFLDADDMIAPGKFAASLNCGEYADIFISDFKIFSDEQPGMTLPFKLSASDFTFESILTGWDAKFVFPPHSGLFKAYLFNDLRFNETLRAREDWLMWLHIFRMDVRTFFIDEPLALYRSSPGSMSQNKLLMDQNLIAVYKIIYPWLPEKHRNVFFDKVMGSFEKSLAYYSSLLHDTTQSKSYRLGNFFIRNLKRLRIAKD